MYDLGVAERVLEQRILRKQFIEAARLLKLPHYERAEKHYKNLERSREVNLNVPLQGKNLHGVLSFSIFFSFYRY